MRGPHMPGWFDELSERAGPLREAARGFCAWRSLDPTARGIHAAEALGRTLYAFCHEAEGDDPYEEDRFIEGAGAYLGLLTLDAHGGAGHCQANGNHRIRLGPHGWFDPFKAIDAALDAERPLDSLAESLAQAEAEARDQGPISRVLTALYAALSRDHPNVRVVREFELDVELDDGTQIDLRRLASALSWPSTDDDQRRLVRDAERLVAMLPRRGTSEASRVRTHEEVVESLTRLLPRPISADFTEGLPNGVHLATVALEADVVLAYVEQHAGRARFLRAEELVELGGAALVHATALRNLQQRVATMRFERLDVHGHTWVAGRSGDGLDAARIVLSEAHARARALVPNVALAVIPHRDTILFGPSDDREALQRYAGDLMARAPHPISARALSLR